MKASVILAHPYPKSFNHAIFETVCSRLDDLKLTVFKHDLYKEKFSPILTVDELGSDKSNDPLENIWKLCIFEFCGIEKFYRRMFRIISESDLDQRKRWLQEVESIVEKVTGK